MPGCSLPGGCASPVRPARQGRWFGPAQTAILIALLALTVARTTLGELPFGRRPLADAGAYAGHPVSRQLLTPTELTRVVSAVVIVALAAGWAWTGAMGQKRLTLHHGALAVGLVLLAVCLFVSAGRAANRREALNGAAEQISLLLAALMMMQLAREPWRRRLVLVVLAGVATMLAGKALFQLLVEIPEQIADFQAHGQELLATLGHAPGSPAARMFETRLREFTAKGWFGLANPFGSLLVPVFVDLWGMAGLPSSLLRRSSWTHSTTSGGRVSSDLRVAI